MILMKNFRHIDYISIATVASVLLLLTSIVLLYFSILMLIGNVHSVDTTVMECLEEAIGQ